MVRKEPDNADYADHDRVPGAPGMAERGPGREGLEGLNERGGLHRRPVCGRLEEGENRWKSSGLNCRKLSRMNGIGVERIEKSILCL